MGRRPVWLRAFDLLLFLVVASFAFGIATVLPKLHTMTFRLIVVVILALYLDRLYRMGKLMWSDWRPNVDPGRAA